jgi:hypothetical protein
VSLASRPTSRLTCTIRRSGGFGDTLPVRFLCHRIEHTDHLGLVRTHDITPFQASRRIELRVEALARGR